MAAVRVFLINIGVHRAVTLPFVSCGCEIWSVTVREELELRKLGHKRDEVTRKWIRLHNEDLTDLYCSPIVVRVIQ